MLALPIWRNRVLPAGSTLASAENRCLAPAAAKFRLSVLPLSGFPLQGTALTYSLQCGYGPMTIDPETHFAEGECSFFMCRASGSSVRSKAQLRPCSRNDPATTPWASEWTDSDVICLRRVAMADGVFLCARPNRLGDPGSVSREIFFW